MSGLMLGGALYLIFFSPGAHERVSAVHSFHNQVLSFYLATHLILTRWRTLGRACSTRTVSNVPSRISWLDMDRIAETKCLVVGAGALGNEVVKNLVLSGFQHIELSTWTMWSVPTLIAAFSSAKEMPIANAESGDRSVEGSGARSVCSHQSLRSRGSRPTMCTGSGRIDLVLGCLDNIAARLHVNSHSYSPDVRTSTAARTASGEGPGGHPSGHALPAVRHEPHPLPS